MIIGIGMDHIIKNRNFSILITYDREIDGGVLGFVNVLYPSFMRFNTINTEGNDLNIPFVKFSLVLGNCT